MSSVTKSLAGIEDLLLGVGQVNQQRSGGTYPITKIRLIWPCADTAELTNLDTERFKYAYLGGKVYHFDGQDWKVDKSTSLYVEYTVGSDQALTASIAIGAYKTADVKAYFVSALAPISLVGYFFKNGASFAAATAFNSGGFPGAGSLSLSASATEVIVTKTAGSTVGTGKLVLILDNIHYA